MIVALERAVIERDSRWTTDRELLATISEIMSVFMRQHAMANGAKNPGKSLHIKRPWEKDEKPDLLSFGAFARQIAAARG